MAHPELRFARRAALAAACAAPLALLGLVVLGSPPAASAHPFLNDRLVLLDRQIAEDPENARLRVSRGSILLDEHHLDEALAELDRALELEPDLSVVHLLRSQALLQAGRADAAVVEARRYLELDSESPTGWRALARALDAVESPASGRSEALAAYDRFFELASDPSPDDVLEAADAAVRRARPDAAILRLEGGIERLGELTAFLQAAEKIEETRGKMDAALAYVDRILATSPRTATWQVERARLLLAADRDVEARAALAEAERALGARRTSRGESDITSTLSREISNLRRQLDAPARAAGRTP